MDREASPWSTATRHLALLRWTAPCLAAGWITSGYLAAPVSRRVLYLLCLIALLYNMTRSRLLRTGLPRPLLIGSEWAWLMMTTALTGGLRSPMMVIFVILVDVIVTRAGTSVGVLYGAAVTAALGGATWAAALRDRPGLLLAYGVIYLAVFTLVTFYVGARRTNPSGRGHAFVTSSNEASRLTARELEVLELIAQGKRDQEVCRELYIAASTLKTHRANLFRKLDARNRVEAVRKAEALGLIPPP